MRKGFIVNGEYHIAIWIKLPVSHGIVRCVIGYKEQGSIQLYVCLGFQIQDAFLLNVRSMLDLGVLGEQNDSQINGKKFCQS